MQKLLKPVIFPRAGLEDVVGEDDPVTFPVFSVLLLYFVVAIGYGITLRRYWVQLDDASPFPAPDMAPSAIGALTAAVPFITALTALIGMLLTGAFLMLAGRLAGSRRPYGHWVGLAAFTLVPGSFRLLWETARLTVGRPPADVPALSLAHLVSDAVTLGSFGLRLLQSMDPFQIWSLLIMAVGFSLYASRSTWQGVLVALTFLLLQVLLATGWANPPVPVLSSL